MKNIGSVLATGGPRRAPVVGCGGGNKEAAAPTGAGGGGGTPTASATHVDVGGAEASSTPRLDALNAHDKANDWNDRRAPTTREAVRGAASAQASGKFPEATYNAGLAVPALRATTRTRRRTSSRRSRTTRSSTRARAARALPVQGRRRTSTRRSARSSRPSTTRSSRTSPALVDLAMFQMQRDSTASARTATRSRRQGRDLRLRLREAEPPARARHRRRLHAGVQPARPLLLRAARRRRRGSGKKFGRTIATNAALGEARRRAAARARRARVLAGHPKEPELRADPQHGGPHPERARASERAR